MIPTTENDSNGRVAVELRVLHGPQAGSRLALIPQESYLLGSGDDCAIMLAGAQIQAEHARLTVQDGHWWAVSEQGSVATLDGQACDSQRTLEFGTVVQMGLVKLTVEVQGAPWPNDEALEPQPRPQPAAEPSSTEDLHEAPEPVSAVAEGPSAPPSAPQRRLMAAALLMGLAGSAVALTAYAGWQLSSPALPTVVASEVDPAPTPAQPSPQEALRAWMEPLQGPGRLVLDGEGAGPWRVMGHMNTAIEREQLVQSARSLPWPVEIDVAGPLERQATVRQFLEAQSSPKVSARITGTQGATLQVRVVAESLALAEGVAARLREVNGHLEPFAFELLLPPDVRQRFLDGLQANGLGSRFDVLRSEPDLTLSASLPQSEVGNWERYFSAFTAEYGSVLTINASVHTERESVERRIRAVVSGRYPYVITTSGERVAPGGLIDGKVLASIGAQEVVFADGLRVRFHP